LVSFVGKTAGVVLRAVVGLATGKTTAAEVLQSLTPETFAALALNL
jgi:hypothetical protein